MLHFERWKIIAILGTIFVGFLFALPNFVSKETLESWPSFLPKRQMPLGLDLQGGAHLLLEVDVQADNTFDTVEASLELRTLMRDSSTSFEAIQKLEAPTFEQIFKNEELRREFENLTRKLDAPTS